MQHTRTRDDHQHIAALVEQCADGFRQLFDAPIDTKQQFGNHLQRIEEQESALVDLLHDIAEILPSESSNTSRAELFASNEARAIALIALRDTAESHAHLWSTTIHLLRSCERWGGHPRMRGFPTDPDAIRALWFHRLLYVQPRTDDERAWRRRYLSALIIAFALREGNATPEFRQMCSRTTKGGSHIHGVLTHFSSLGYTCEVCAR